MYKRLSSDAWFIAGSRVLVEIIDKITNAIDEDATKYSSPPPSTEPPCCKEPFALAGESYDFKIDVRNGGAECTLRPYKLPFTMVFVILFKTCLTGNARDAVLSWTMRENGKLK